MHDTTQVASKTQPPTQVASVTICDKAISRVVYKDQPVLTFALIDQLHQRAQGTAADRFKKNRQRFLENEDFYLIDYSKKGILYPFGIDIPPRGLIVLTQTGYAMLAKVFTDDLAWQVQRELVNKYFATPQPTDPILEHAKLNKELMDLFGIQGNMQTLALNNAMRKKFGLLLGRTQTVFWQYFEGLSQTRSDFL